MLLIFEMRNKNSLLKYLRARRYIKVTSGANFRENRMRWRNPLEQAIFLSGPSFPVVHLMACSLEKRDID